MLDKIIDTLTIPFTRDLSFKQMALAFGLFLVVAILAADTLNILKEGLNNG